VKKTSKNVKQLTYLAVKFNFFIIVNKVLTVFVTSEYSKCLPLVRIQSRRILLHGSMASTIMRVNNALFHSSRPAHQSDVVSNDSYHAPLSGTIVAKLCQDLVVEWMEKVKLATWYSAVYNRFYN